MKKNALIILLFLSSVFAKADESGWCGNNLRWSYVEATKTVTISGTGSMYNYGNLSGLSPWYNRNDIETIIIEDGVTSIGRNAFGYCRGLMSVTIPNSVTSIEKMAFSGCSSLTPVHITDLEAWCKIAFEDSESNPLSYAHHLYLNGEEIRKLVIPNTLTSIGNYTFCGCNEIVSVTIPNSVTSIGDGAFYGCSGLTSVNIPNSVTTIGSRAFSSCSGLTSVTIPNSVINIGDNAFQYCSGLISVTIPNSVTSIGNYAFQDCSGLTSVTIPNSVTSIGGSAFQDCGGLTSVTIPNSVTTIGWGTFSGCRSLTTIDIPNSVTSIEDNAFYNCYSLTSIDIPNTVTSVGNYAFYNCGYISSVNIPNSVTSIGEYAFYNCAMKTLTLPEDLKIIKKGTFQGCYNLSEVVIPAKMEFIYAEAFSRCGLRSVTSLAVNPPFCHDLAFSNYNIPLYVPSEAVNSYQETNPWSKFSELKTISGETVDNKCATPTISYADKKLTFSCATEGVEFVTKITDTDIKDHNGSEINLTATYNISVYAMKSGYVNSDVATATLVWTEAIFTETTEPSTSAKAVTESIPVLISAQNGTITVRGEQNGLPLAVFTADGKMIGSATMKDGQASISTNLQRGEIAIVKVGSKSVKIKM